MYGIHFHGGENPHQSKISNKKYNSVLKHTNFSLATKRYDMSVYTTEAIWPVELGDQKSVHQKFFVIIEHNKKIDCDLKYCTPGSERNNSLYFRSNVGDSGSIYNFETYLLYT